jgi:hypothetical protein
LWYLFRCTLSFHSSSLFLSSFLAFFLSLIFLLLPHSVFIHSLYIKYSLKGVHEMDAYRAGRVLSFRPHNTAQKLLD